MDTLLQDVRLALRRLRRDPGFAAAAIGTLALGIGAVVAIFGVVDAVLLRSLPYPESDRLVRVYPVADDGARTSASPPDFVDWRREAGSFERMAAYHPDDVTLTGEGDAERLRAARVTPGFFETLGVPPALGRGFRPEEETAGRDRVVVLSHGLWRARFGSDTAVVGRAVRLDGRRYEVVGVAPRGFDHPPDVHAWIPRSFTPDDLATQRGGRYLAVVARLSPYASPEGAAAEMEAIAARLEAEHPESNTGLGAAVVPMREAIVGDVRRALLMLLGAVGLVLLVACANVTGLALTRAVGRRRELAVRAALGADRGRLARAALTESVVIAIAGGTAGLALAWWGTELLLALRPPDLPRLEEVGIGLPVVAFAAGAALAAGLGSGVLPALQAGRRVDLHGRLKDGSRGVGDRGATRLRSGLVVAEIALAVLLLAGAGLLMRSFLNLQGEDPGFTARDVLTFELSMPDERYGPDRARDLLRELVARADELPDVREAGAVFGLPLSGFSYVMSVERRDGAPAYDRPGEEPYVHLRVATPGYFRALGIPVLEGRALRPTDRAGAVPVVVVSRSAADLLWPGEEAVGRTFELGTTLGLGGPRAGGEVVGVVADVRDRGPDGGFRPLVYVAHAQFPVGFASVALRTAGEPSELAGPARALVRELDPELAPDRFRTMEELLAGTVARSRFYTLLLAIFSGLAVFLAAVGVYGLAAHGVRARTRELGLRIALGASRRDMARLVLARAAALAATGTALGLVAALLSGGALRGLLFGLEPRDPVTLATVGLLLAGVALLASWVPARRAMRVDPSTALRAE